MNDYETTANEIVNILAKYRFDYYDMERILKWVEDKVKCQPILCLDEETIALHAQHCNAL